MTTGQSVREVVDVVRERGAEVVAVAAIVRREPQEFNVPTVTLLDLPVRSIPAIARSARIGSRSANRARAACRRT
jgi:orotate phosphoribosyltransferase